MNAGLIELIRTFTRTVEVGSFTAVSKELHLTQPTVSRHISSLEQHLGVRLMHRTTRSLSLTQEGQIYYEHARGVLDAIEAAALAIRPGDAMLSGNIKIAAPLTFARICLFPMMRHFLDANPNVTTDWVLSDRASNLVEEGVDIAIRIGQVMDHNLIVRRIGEMRTIIVATPEYWQKHGRPATPMNLTEHDCIIFSGLAKPEEWHFKGTDGLAQTVTVQGRVRVNASEGVRSAVLEGLGVGVVPTWQVANEVNLGLLEQVLMTYRPDALPIQAVIPSRRLVPARVKAFSDFLATQFRSELSFSNDMRS